MRRLSFWNRAVSQAAQFPWQRGTIMLSRRHFIHTAAAMGAAFAWGGPARASKTKWTERRELYPEGVASGDPDSSSVMLITRESR